MKKRFPQQDLADRLRAAIAAAEVSQADLARACGVTEQSVHGWVTNGRISKQHLPTIAALTGKGLEYFLVGLKTWRRAAAIALPILSSPLVLVALFEFVRPWLLCKIRARISQPREALHIGDRLASGTLHSLKACLVSASMISDWPMRSMRRSAAHRSVAHLAQMTVVSGCSWPTSPPTWPMSTPISLRPLATH